ncbi:MAG: hypothetical protein ACRC06_09000 [Waterburya sp.]
MTAVFCCIDNLWSQITQGKKIRSTKLIPPLTQEIPDQVFPQGNIYMTLRDELGTFYDEGCQLPVSTLSIT